MRQRAQGTLFRGKGRAALLLQNAGPPAGADGVVYLRYAFVVQGVESHILPAFVLDDWGKEIRSLELYEWVQQYGDQFPRAEIFGFDLSGQPAQYFLRELELVSKLPCYAYVAKDTPLAEGALVEAILLPDAGVAAPQRRKRPPAAEVGGPMAAARVSWWRVNPASAAFDFSLLETA